MREEPTLFSEEVARGEKDLETELRERSDESRPYQYCPFCWRPVDRREADTFFEATVWTHDLETRTRVLGEYTGQAAHRLCIKGVVEQRRLTSQAPDESTAVGEAVQHAGDEIPGQLVLIPAVEFAGNIASHIKFVDGEFARDGSVLLATSSDGDLT